MAKAFKVIFVTAPKAQWEVHYDDVQIGYQAWDQRVALSYAKDLAKKSRPSTILIHNRQGAAQKQIDYPAQGSAIETDLDTTVDS